MRRLFCLSLCLFWLILCAACGVSSSDDSAGSASPTPDGVVTESPSMTPLPDGPADSVVVREDFWEHAPAESPPLLMTSASFPFLEDHGRPELAAISEQLLDIREGFYTRCEQMLEEARARRDEGSAAEASVCTFTYAVERNDGGVLSLRYEQYRYIDGGAHGETETRCATYDLHTGRRLYLEDFVTTPGGIDALVRAVAEQCGLYPEDYYPDYALLARECLPYDAFCVTPDGIALFYPELTLAPLMAGVLRFDIPWAALETP